MAVSYLEGKQIAEGALEKLQSQVNAIDQVYELYAAVLNIVRSFMRLPPGHMKVENFKEDLRDLKFPEDSISDFVNVLYGPKREILDNNLSKSDFYLKLENLKWQVDITISSSVLSRVLEPSIRFEMILNNGRRCIFEVSISKFHELRFSVASVLKEIESLEKRKFLKGSG
ncbi:COMM domain-containing protein 5 isoform X2 [Anabrus simplex]|uniref:COMM domain-containing protein 5 isoform X2 n=1 Tax=Anabrus simplex TaxID=316456 RepID=UPI0034DCFC04